MHSMDALHHERWLPSIGGHEVSDLGRLRNLDGEIVEVKSYSTKPGGSPYKRFRRRYLHHLVLEAFVGPKPRGMQCRHINGDSLDNRLENLAWGTPSEDNNDRVRNGTHQHSSRTECPHGHPLDGVRYRKDGTVLQRYCKTCLRIRSREIKAAQKELKTSCPQGHPFDGVRLHRGHEQRYCTICAAESLDRGRRNRVYSDKCKNCGGEFVLRKSGTRHCPKCSLESSRRSKARKKQG